MIAPSPSPLAEIERTVQQRATSLALDVDTPEGEQALRALIDEAVREWSDDTPAGAAPSRCPTRKVSAPAPSATWPGTAP